MTEMSDDQLKAELAQREQEEREQAEAARRQEVAEREAQLEPEQRAKKEETHPTELIGLVLRIDPRVGPSKAYGTYSAVIELRTLEQQEWTVWCNEGGALYAQLVRLRIQPGEVVAIAYRGKKVSEATGFSYHDIRLVRVDQDEEGLPAAEVNYDALRRDRETPALPEGDAAPEPHDDIPF
jgi:hypothetical protein